MTTQAYLLFDEIEKIKTDLDVLEDQIDRGNIKLDNKFSRVKIRINSLEQRYLELKAAR